MWWQIGETRKGSPVLCLPIGQIDRKQPIWIILVRGRANLTIRQQNNKIRQTNHVVISIFLIEQLIVSITSLLFPFLSQPWNNIKDGEKYQKEAANI